MYYKKLNMQVKEEHGGNQMRTIKGDVSIYLSKFNRHPSPTDHDYHMNSKELFLDMKKDIPYLNAGILFMAFYSFSDTGCRMLFQYCFEKEPPSVDIVPPVVNTNLNSIR